MGLATHAYPQPHGVGSEALIHRIGASDIAGDTRYRALHKPRHNALAYGSERDATEHKVHRGPCARLHSLPLFLAIARVLQCPSSLLPRQELCEMHKPHSVTPDIPPPCLQCLLTVNHNHFSLGQYSKYGRDITPIIARDDANR